MGAATETAEAKVIIFMDVEDTASFLLLLDRAGVARDQTGRDKGGGGGMGLGLLVVVMESAANNLVDEPTDHPTVPPRTSAASCERRNIVLGLLR